MHLTLLVYPTSYYQNKAKTKTEIMWMMLPFAVTVAGQANTNDSDVDAAVDDDHEDDDDDDFFADITSHTIKRCICCLLECKSFVKCSI